MPSVEEDRRNAKEKLKGFCGVYRECDGDTSRLCQGQSYGRKIGMGGVGSGHSFRNNILALRNIKLRMDTVANDKEPANTEITFLGKKISMPIMAASVTGVNSFGGEVVITEKEFSRAVVLGSKAAGTIGFRGDTYTYTLDEPHGINAIAEADGWGIKIVNPREQEAIKEFFKLAENAKAIAVGVDLDGCGSTIMSSYKKPVFKKTKEEIKELVKSTSLPFIAKGIMCADDAQEAVEAGASVIVVSNHGGRVLDHTPGTADVLPLIVDRIKGKATILMDGGIRTGFDVLKALALGAQGILMGRDIIRSAIGGGTEGVTRLLAHTQKTLAKAMKLTGNGTINEITDRIIYKQF